MRKANEVPISSHIQVQFTKIAQFMAPLTPNVTMRGAIAPRSAVHPITVPITSNSNIFNYYLYLLLLFNYSLTKNSKCNPTNIVKNIFQQYFQQTKKRVIINYIK